MVCAVLLSCILRQVAIAVLYPGMLGLCSCLTLLEGRVGVLVLCYSSRI